MDFETMIDRRGKRQAKWDLMEQLFGVAPEDGLSMWTADSDYATAPCVLAALREAEAHGVFGYGRADAPYLAAIQWWMRERHAWEIETDWILTTAGLGNAIGLSLDLWTAPGDHVAIFTPVYHEFPLKIRRNGREVTECPLALRDGRYELDFEAAEAALTGRETMLIWCSPQNPSGRVWTAEELRAVADFAARHDLLILSDEVHQDLVFPGETFVPMAVAVPEALPRLVVLNAASKTFNIAGQRIGNMIIPDDRLRGEMSARLAALDLAPTLLGVQMVTAAYSPEGAAWADAQIRHLDRNRKIFDAGLAKIPGVVSMPLQATYLAWVDFRGTGMDHSELCERIYERARLAVSPGPSFGTGGEGFMRINLATQTARVEEAVSRLQEAFSDLQ